MLRGWGAPSCDAVRHKCSVMHSGPRSFRFLQAPCCQMSSLQIQIIESIGKGGQGHIYGSLTTSILCLRHEHYSASSILYLCQAGHAINKVRSHVRNHHSRLHPRSVCKLDWGAADHAAALQLLCAVAYQGLGKPDRHMCPQKQMAWQDHHQSL